MNDLGTIHARVRRLQERAQQITRWSFVHLMCSEAGWTATASRIVEQEHVDRFADPVAALEALETAIAFREKHATSLAQTLGIAEAAL